MPERRSPRLKGYDYTTPGFYLVTICAKDRKRVFTDKDFTDKEMNRLIIEILKSEKEKQSVKLIAFCIMPDHIHLLIEIPAVRANLSTFVGIFKGRITPLFRKYKSERNIWQTRFYDRVLRKSENIVDAAVYILNNPVRKGMVDRWEDYEFCGLIDEA